MNYNLTVGINLDNRNIYFNVPNQTIINEFKYIIKTDNSDNYIAEDIVNGVSRGYYHYVNSDNQEVFGLFYTSDGTNLESIKLPSNFGTITEVNVNSILYEYIKRVSHEKVYVISEDFAKAESMDKDTIKSTIEEITQDIVESKILIGTTEPNNNLGNNGDIYFQYSE